MCAILWHCVTPHFLLCVLCPSSSLCGARYPYRRCLRNASLQVLIHSGWPDRPFNDNVSTPYPSVPKGHAAHVDRAADHIDLPHTVRVREPLALAHVPVAVEDDKTPSEQAGQV